MCARDLPCLCVPRRYCLGVVVLAAASKLPTRALFVCGSQGGEHWSSSSVQLHTISKPHNNAATVLDHEIGLSEWQ